MYLQMNGLRIKSKHLNNISWTNGSAIRFSGVALDWEGDEICRRLLELGIGRIVEVIAEFHIFDTYEGICKIDEMEIPPREETDKGPVIYRFSGTLRPVNSEAYFQYPRETKHPEHRYIV